MTQAQDKTVSADAGNKMFAPSKQISLGGETFTARTLSMGNMADFEDFMRSRRAAAFLDMAHEKLLGSDIVSDTLKAIYNEPLSAEQQAAQSQSIAGILFLVHCSICHDRPGMSVEDLGKLLVPEDMAAVMDVLGLVTEEPLPNPPEAPALEVEIPTE